MNGLFAVRTGLEPATSCVTGRHSNQLNYRTLLVKCNTGEDNFGLLALPLSESECKDNFGGLFYKKNIEYFKNRRVYFFTEQPSIDGLLLRIACYIFRNLWTFQSTGRRIRTNRSDNRSHQPDTVLNDPDAFIHRTCIQYLVALHPFNID